MADDLRHHCGNCEGIDPASCINAPGGVNELRRGYAEAANARAKALHARDDSNPLGPWCGTCTTSWPCRTWTVLDVPADGEQPSTLTTEKGNPHG